MFYHYAQARLKQPFQHRSALVGAANALVSESTHQTLGLVEEHDAPIYPSTPNIFKDISQSKRLSIYILAVFFFAPFPYAFVITEDTLSNGISISSNDVIVTNLDCN